jgi:acyl-CoA reductase-like NAD-dependent aldehyde dehydrogenase
LQLAGAGGTGAASTGSEPAAVFGFSAGEVVEPPLGPGAGVCGGGVRAAHPKQQSAVPIQVMASEGRIRVAYQSLRAEPTLYGRSRARDKRRDMVDVVFSKTNPADDSPLPAVEATPIGEIAKIVERARAAQREWAARSLADRSERLMQFARHILEARADGLPILAGETGRSETECLMSELVSAVEYAKQAIRVAKKTLVPERVKLPMLDYPGKRVVVELLPRGVVAVIAPWNYPFGNFMKSFFPALLSGNALVLKPSEHTPRSGAWVKKLADDVLPKDLVELVQGGGDVGQALLDSAIDAVVFTGSVKTGRRVAARAGEKLIPCSVELGGKDAAIVLADCDLDRTVAGIAQWGVHNAGQNCAAIERVYVEEAIADRFVDNLGRVVAKLRVAPEDPSDLGPLQNEAQLRIVESHVDEAKSSGARVVCGGRRTGKGLGYAPTVLDRCTETMRVMREETFGPVIAVQRVKDADEALARANQSDYGLNGSVWTSDIERGEALARRLEVGIALVNNHAITGILAETPWTGVKDTGFGVASSHHAYHAFTRPRTVFVDRSKKPDPWWMPSDAAVRPLAEALIERQLHGGLGVLLRLGGLVGKRVAAIRALATESENPPKALPAGEKRA